MNIRLTLYFILIAAIAPLPVTGQSTSPTPETSPSSEPPRDSVGLPIDTRVMIARSSNDYPVTPGDVYTLRFQNSQGRPETIELAVQADASVTIGFLGPYDAGNEAFVDLRSRVLSDFSSAYPGSFPELTIQQVGTFLVDISGAYLENQAVRAWGLSTVSSLVANLDSERVDTRNVFLHRENEAFRVDVQMRLLNPAADREKRLRPGDKISLSAPGHSVELSGQAVRTGRFQVIPNETVRDIVETFGGGTLEGADLSGIQVRGTFLPDEGRIVTLDQSASIAALDVDSIYVPAESDVEARVHIEGAIVPPDVEVPQGQAGQTFNYVQKSVRWYEGETVATLVRRYDHWLSPNADLRNAVLRRETSIETIPVDLTSIGPSSRAATISVRPEDRIMIPFRQPQVVVSGAVSNPGSFQFVPNRGYEYYLRLAGGIDGQRRIGRNPRILGADGEKRPDHAMIEPGDTIHFTSNHPWYHVGPVFTVVSTVLSTYALIQNISR